MCLAQGHNAVTPVRLESMTLGFESNTLHVALTGLQNNNFVNPVNSTYNKMPLGNTIGVYKADRHVETLTQQIYCVATTVARL